MTNLMTMPASSVTSLFQDHLYTLDVPAIPMLVKISVIFTWLIQTSGTWRYVTDFVVPSTVPSTSRVKQFKINSLSG